MINRFCCTVLLLSAILIALVACKREVPVLTGATMGTTYSVIVADLKRTDRDPLKIAIDTALRDINDAMSTYQEDSFISRFNASGSIEWFDVPAGFVVVTDAALQIAAASDGAFDPTIGPLVKRWGFGKEQSKSIPSPDEIALLLQQTGYENLSLDAKNLAIKKNYSDLQLDLNAIAKGYAVDQLAAEVEALGYTDFLVEIGGELRVSGSNTDGSPWRIGIETPDASGNSTAGLYLSDNGVATSGDYRNTFEHEGNRYSHIIDARNGAPVTHRLASVTVVADTAMLADGWATALMVLGPDAGMEIAEKLEIACLFIVRDQRQEFSISRSSAFRLLDGQLDSN